MKGDRMDRRKTSGDDKREGAMDKAKGTTCARGAAGENMAGSRAATKFVAESSDNRRLSDNRHSTVVGGRDPRHPA